MKAFEEWWYSEKRHKPETADFLDAEDAFKAGIRHAAEIAIQGRYLQLRTKKIQQDIYDRILKEIEDE